MDSNRLRVASIVETTLGVLPGTPRLRTARITGETLAFAPQYLASNELRSDRMTADSVQIFQQNSGALNWEFSYPYDSTFLSDGIRSALFNAWTNTPQRDNDGTADSVITDIGTTTDTIAFTTGAAFVVGHLVYNSGYTAAANNGLFRVTTGGATSLVSTSSGWSAQAVPPAAARTKVVGFQGVSGDVTAVATGLASTTLDFTTLGLAVGQWVKIGGSGAGFRYATTVDNDWARVTAIAAHLLSLDNLPLGWTTDTGTGKTIRVFFGDRIYNGTSRVSLSIEKGFLGQTTPSYVLHSGMVAGTMNLSMQSRQMVTGSFDFSGTAATVGTVVNGTSYDAATTESVFSSNVSVGRIAENGTTVASPNWVKNFTLQLQNNLRILDAVGNAQAIDIGAGEAGITGTAETYYGDTTLYQKLINGTVTNLNARAASGNRAVVFTLPRVKFTAGSPNASAKNTDMLLPLQFTASEDPLTLTEMSVDRLDYFEV